MELRERFDVFSGTRVAQGVSPLVDPHGVGLYARKP